MKRIASLALSYFLTASVAFADSPKNPDADPAKPAEPAKAKAAKKAEKAEAPETARFAAELEELRQTLQSQQAQIEQLREELAKRDKQIEAAEHTATDAAARAAEASTKAAEAVTTTAAVKTTAASLDTSVSTLKAENVALKASVAAANETAQGEGRQGEAPTSIHIKGITLTPGGFFAAESVWRQRAVSGDINTPFTTIPFSGNSLSRVSEFNASGRQSRIAMLAEGKIEHAKFAGYYETDFLSAAASSNNRQSNSYSLRQRQFWGQAALDNGLTFTGGQMWSLVTETKKGLENRTEAPPMTIDPQYNVGFGWARQYGFRVVKSFNDKYFFGFAVEGPQTTFGGRGVANGTFFIIAPGSGGGLFNPTDTTGYSLNKTPDFIIKAAADPGWGHYELFGVISTFRARVFPCFGAPVSATCPTTASGAFNDTRTGGGVGANFRAPVFGKYGDFGVHVLGGDGVGRYGSAQLADVTARPGGTLAPIRGGQALGTLEFHPNPKLDVYIDYGAEYAYRTWYGVSGASVGYGSPFFNNSGCGTEVTPASPTSPNGAPATCNGDVRNIQEGTIGFWHRPYKGSKGTLAWGLQYSYFVKNTWSGNNNTPGAVGAKPKAIDNMVWTSFRYYLP